MTTKILALLLVGASSMFAATHFSFGIGIGAPYYPYGGYYVAAPPPPPPAYYAPAPAYPAPGYVWVGGYYYPAGAGWAWHRGYWARPPYVGAVWVGPRYSGRRYYGGYWRHR
jgi:hypothetical protein